MVFDITQKPQLIDTVLLVPIKKRSDAETLLKAYTEKAYTCEIREKKDKRSEEANRYMWKLCTEISKVLSKESPTSKEDVYRRAVREGNCYYSVPVKEEAVEHYKRIWAAGKVGWFAEDAYRSPTLEGFITLHAYYGSSEYDTKEMWFLIRIIQEEAETLGIETRTPEELNSLMESWDKAYKKREEKEKDDV